MKYNGYRTFFVALLILISMSIGAAANSQLEKIQAFIRSDFKVQINGIGSNIGPVLIYEDRSYLPVDKVARAVGSNVYWDAETKTIHINNRVQGQQEQKPDEGLIRETIELYMPQAYIAKYNGNEETVLTNTIYSESGMLVYYREKDMQRLGVDTRALSKAIEQDSNDIYIREEELAKSWREKPVFSYMYTLAILGGTDPAKLDYVQNFVDGIPIMEEVLYKQHNVDPYGHQYLGPPQVYAIDFVSENEVDILFRSADKFGKYTLTLKKNAGDKWYYSDYTKRLY